MERDLKDLIRLEKNRNIDLSNLTKFELNMQIFLKKSYEITTDREIMLNDAMKPEQKALK